MPTVEALPQASRRFTTAIPFGTDADLVMEMLQERYPQQEEETPLRVRDTYAWGRLARFLTESHVQGMLATTPPGGNFTLVDLCSSTPIFRELLKGNYSTDALKPQTDFAVQDLLSNIGSGKIGFEGAIDNKWKTISNARIKLATKGTLERNLLWSAIYNTIKTPPGEITEESIENALSSQFQTLSEVQNMRIEPKGKSVIDGQLEKGAWRIYVPLKIFTTLKQRFESVFPTDTQTDRFLDGISKYLALQLAPQLKHVDFLSVDYADIDTFVSNAIHNFPEEFVNTNFFGNAIAGPRSGHVRSDIRKLPFADESVDMFTCLEGFPFYKKLFSQKERMEIVKQVSRILKPGGKALFFPWRMQGESKLDSELKKKLEECFTSMGLELTFESHSKEDLLLDMGERELALTDRSPVFREKAKALDLLIIEKPDLLRPTQ